MPDLERQHARRQAVHRRRRCAPPGRARRRPGRPAPWLWISSAASLPPARGMGGQERADPPAQLLRPRRRVAQGAARADGGAGAAADAQVRLDDDAAAAGAALERGVAADRLGRADVDAGGAADLLVAAVGADLLPVVEELRLLELADALAQLEHRVDQRGVVAGMEIALRRLVQRDLRRRAEIEHEVEGLGHGLRPRAGSRSRRRPRRRARIRGGRCTSRGRSGS